MTKNRFTVDPGLWRATLLPSFVLFITIACITFLLPGTLTGNQNRDREQSAPVDVRMKAHQDLPLAVLLASREKPETAPASGEKQGAYDKNVERWQALPSDQKKELRNRMDQWRNLTPQEQEKYRQRHQKLQEMTPNQRKKVDQGLEKWDTLQPTEKEEIRRLFEE